MTVCGLQECVSILLTHHRNLKRSHAGRGRGDGRLKVKPARAEIMSRLRRRVSLVDALKPIVFRPLQELCLMGARERRLARQLPLSRVCRSWLALLCQRRVCRSLSTASSMHSGVGPRVSRGGTLPSHTGLSGRPLARHDCQQRSPPSCDQSDGGPYLAESATCVRVPKARKAT